MDWFDSIYPDLIDCGNIVGQVGHTQWIAHILKRLHLLDESKRRHDTDEMSWGMP